MKRLLITCLCLIAVVAFLGIQALAKENTHSASMPIGMDEVSANKALLINKGMKQIDCLVREMESVPERFNNYAGHYFGDDGRLVVCFTKSMDFAEGDEFEGVTFKVVRFSDDHLKGIQKVIAQAVKASKGRSDFKIQASATDVRANRVYVWMDSLDEAVTQRVRNLVSPAWDSEAIEFLPAEEEPQNQTNIINGSYTLPQGATGTPPSIAFRARRWVSGAWQNGFITTGHMQVPEPWNMLDGPNVNGPWASVGVMRQQIESGSVDAAFVSSLSSRTPTKSFMNGESYNDISANHITNLFVEVYGATSGKLTGYILQTDWQGFVGGVFFTNLIKANYVGQAGDSGAAICWVERVDLMWIRHVTGIHKASTDTWSLFVRVDTALTALGAQGY